MSGLLDLEDTVNGSDGADALTAFAETFDLTTFLPGYPDILIGGAGDDFLISGTFAANVLVGGSETTLPARPTHPHAVVSSKLRTRPGDTRQCPGRLGGASETNTLVVLLPIYGFAAITDIDALQFEGGSGFTPGVVFATDQIGSGLISSSLQVEGHGANEITIRRGGVAAVNLDLYPSDLDSFGGPSIKSPASIS